MMAILEITLSIEIAGNPLFIFFGGKWSLIIEQFLK
jgi:hypothetical protein